MLYITKRYKNVHKIIYPTLVPLTMLADIKSKIKEERKYNFIWMR